MSLCVVVCADSGCVGAPIAAADGGNVPLVFRSTSDSKTAFIAISGRLQVGAVRRDKFAGDHCWSWFLSAVTGLPNAVHTRGVGDDFEVCRAALEANWQRWLELAGLQERRATA